MNKTPNDIDQLLPYGEMLRSFMEQSFITKSDLKELLRSRGVFTYGNEKQDSIPVLMSTILSPSEFDSLRECQSIKEDNPKVVTQTIEWDSDKNLLDSLPDHFNLNSMLDLEFSNFKVSGSPAFVPVDGDPDKLKMDFKVEREDMSKSWASSKNVFPGSLEVTRIKEDGEVKLVVTHTANETKYVASKASTNIVKHFKNNGLIKQEKEVERISYDKFSNQKRIEYLLSLSEKIDSEILKFCDILDIEFSPDKSQILPTEIKWMEEKIDDLRMNGSGLHKTHFIKEASFQNCIHLYRIDSRFKFDLKGICGQCVVTFHFPDFSKSKDATSELEINIKNLSFESPPRSISKNDVKEAILKDVDKQKLRKYKISADLR